MYVPLWEAVLPLPTGRPNPSTEEVIHLPDSHLGNFSRNQAGRRGLLLPTGSYGGSPLPMDHHPMAQRPLGSVPSETEPSNHLLQAALVPREECLGRGRHSAQRQPRKHDRRLAGETRRLAVPHAWPKHGSRWAAVENQLNIKPSVEVHLILQHIQRVSEDENGSH